MTVFFLLRHGYADYSLADRRRLKGAARDLVPLTSCGLEQIKQTAQTLREIRADIIISSPMTRALQSAAILSRLLDLPLEVEFDLHEWIPDLTFSYDQSEVSKAAYAEMLEQSGEWPKGEVRNWEPLSSVRSRVIGVLMRYCNFRHVIVVCHGVVIFNITGKEIETGNYWPYILGSTINFSQQAISSITKPT